MSAFRRFTGIALTLAAAWLVPGPAGAIPAFARQYQMSCAACHAAFPRLNEFGEQFVAMNYRLPNWKAGTVSGGDDMLALPASVPFAMRAQAYVQRRQAGAIDVQTGERTSADTDIQAPYLVKLLSSAPLSDHISYYFYGIFAEKGENGLTIIEDAWFSHDDIFGTGTSMMLGQFQVSDLMFPRELRMTFQDYMVYRMGGLTYDRGVLFSREAGPVELALGWVNGNGIEDNVGINSPGYKRPDHLFDDDSGKAVFGRIGGRAGPVTVGLFAYSGSQKNATGPAGTGHGPRDTGKTALGLDLSGKIGARTWWFAQVIRNEWDGFLDPARKYTWTGGFIGVDYVHSDKWTFSCLYNHVDAGDLAGTDTVYEGLDMRTLTLTASYYFMRNVKGVIEANADLLDTVARTGTYFTGHLEGENYLLLGFDAAF